MEDRGEKMESASSSAVMKGVDLDRFAILGR